MLNTELAAGGELRMVPGEDVARAKSELPLRDEDSLGRTTLQHLRTNPGADVVVLGSYTMIPADPQRRIRLDVRLQDTAGGETIAVESVSGDENDLFNLVSDLGGKLRRSLGVASPSEEIEIATRAALPSNEKAARLYAEGRAKMWQFDYAAARDLLNKAIATLNSIDVHVTFSNILSGTPRSWDPSLLSECSNPSCSAVFRHLQNGEGVCLTE
jgi:curli biogenesis system outer membrane secretion channel CsgG